MATKKATTTKGPQIIPGCIPRVCSTFAGIGPCPHGVQWGRQAAGATWQSRHRLVDQDGTLGAWEAAACRETPATLKAQLEGRILAMMAREYPAIEGQYLDKIVRTIRRGLRENLHERHLLDTRYMLGQVCKKAGGNDSMAAYLATYLYGAERAAEILYPAARKAVA